MQEIDLDSDLYRKFGYHYLLSPYTHEDDAVMTYRANCALRATAWLMLQGVHAQSPIVHSHFIAMYMGWDPRDGVFWMEQDAPLLAGALSGILLAIPGWDISSGIYLERASASQQGKTIALLRPELCGIPPMEEGEPCLV